MKAGRLIPFVDERRVGGGRQVKLYDPSLTRVIPNILEMSFITKQIYTAFFRVAGVDRLLSVLTADIVSWYSITCLSRGLPTLDTPYCQVGPSSGCSLAQKRICG